MDLKKINTKGLRNGDSITVEELLARADGAAPERGSEASDRGPAIQMPVIQEPASPPELTREEAEPLPATAGKNRYEMNGLEKSYSLVLASDPEVHRFWHHPFRIRLCDNQFYEVDFLVQYKDSRVEIHETKVEWTKKFKSGPKKGKVFKQRGREDSRNKLRVIAALYPFKVKIMSRIKAKDGGGWHEEVLSSKGLPLIVGESDGAQQSGGLPIPLSA